MPAAPSFVVITQARPIDYRQDYVSLPREYGSPAYEARADVQAIRAALNENLAELDRRTGFTAQIRGRKVVIKPNLVTVYHHLGTLPVDSPETTDPRVLDALVLFLQGYTRQIVIAESSGRGIPTRGAFKVAGIDRLARLRGVELIALEEQPTDRYLLPKARVMKEIVVPRLISEIARGEAFFISLPKMKTNLYTGVTLGFKNAMGAIPYNLRQRNHNYAIDQKLVDILTFCQPDLVIIDGIVGGEGNCPAPVDPVDSRVIVSGNQCVETDRAATRLMGFDPAKIELLRLADAQGFGDPAVKLIGEARVTPFRPADFSLTGAWMAEKFPNVRVLIGHSLNQAPRPESARQMSRAVLQAQERACRGGCQAVTRFAFDMLACEGQKRGFQLTLVIGAGVELAGERYYYDREGRGYTPAEIAALPGKTIAIGTCARALKGKVRRFVDGCMPFPNAPHQAIHLLTGSICKVMLPSNRFLVPLLLDTLATCEKRKQLLRSGLRLDIPLQHADKLYPIRELSAEEQGQDYILEPFDPLTPAEVRALCAAENRAVLATFWP